MENSIITLDQLVVTAEPGTDPTPSKWGFVIDKDGRTHSLTRRFTHGVIVAVMYPEVATANGVAVPAGPLEEVNVFEYQRFEHDVSHKLPIVRIALSYLSNQIYVSKGRFAATNAQIDAIRRALIANGSSLRDTLTGEEDDKTIAQFLDELRQEQQEERQAEDEPSNRVAR